MILQPDKLFFTSDLHFWHKNILKFTERPYKTIEEMNEGLIESWNNVVPKDGKVFILGDMFFCSATKAKEILEQLNGELHLVLGNHDKGMKQSVKDHFHSIERMREIRVADEDAPRGVREITLCHYAMRVWNNSHHGAWQLFGHSHGGMPEVGKQMDVGIDSSLSFLDPFPYEAIKCSMGYKEISFPDNHNERTNR